MKQSSLCLNDAQGAAKHASGNGQGGQSLAELALLLPVLVLIMTGVLDLGRAFHAYVTVVNAAREGARYGAFHPTDSLGIRGRIEAEAATSGIDLTQSTVIIETDAISPGSPIKVTVVHQFQPLTRIILSSPIISISGSVSMVQF